MDVQFGSDEDTSAHEQLKKSAYSRVFVKTNQLRHIVSNLRAELKQQREREAEFRDASETANTAAVRWTIIQMIVLVVVGAWQLQHLSRFFVKKKLV